MCPGCDTAAILLESGPNPAKDLLAVLRGLLSHPKKPDESGRARTSANEPARQEKQHDDGK